MVTVGTCGNCGGPVQVPECWSGSVPPPKRCAHCGAIAKPNYGPVLPMQPPRTLDTYDAGGWKYKKSTGT